VTAPIAPGEWLGLLGGGQLGRMFAMAAQSLGFRVVVLDPAVDGPAAAVADRHIHADYLDAAGLSRLAATARAATTEFENVPAAALDVLARQCRVAPSATSVAIAQDRIREKAFVAAQGIAVAPHAVLASREDASRVAADLVPGIVKRARLGYDGKGQVRVADARAVAAAFDALGGVPAVLERFIDLAAEVSVIVARRERGDACTWAVAENHHRDGILDVSIVPARIDAAIAARARDIAIAIAEALDYRGVLCVEFFVARDGALLVNELAPRPHNSGHLTFDACRTSQFEQQLRAICGLPLGSPELIQPAAMANLLGELWADGEPDWAAALTIPDVKLHLYGKSTPRPGRKMGHLTAMARTRDEARARVLQARSLLHPKHAPRARW
jgi:5-(carboxyamino)imidazole ribonucleotide synthase